MHPDIWVPLLCSVLPPGTEENIKWGPCLQGASNMLLLKRQNWLLRVTLGGRHCERRSRRLWAADTQALFINDLIKGWFSRSQLEGVRVELWRWCFRKTWAEAPTPDFGKGQSLLGSRLKEGATRLHRTGSPRRRAAWIHPGTSWKAQPRRRWVAEPSECY